jgi:uncharacterized protein DUF4149
VSEKLNFAVRTISLLLLALWLGAALFFSAAVAPAVFGVLRDSHVLNANEVAGAIVKRSLSVINVSGFVASLALLATAFVVKLRNNRRLFLVQVISPAIMGIMTALGQWLISARMLELRTAMQVPIDQIARDDPRRVAFDSLHHYSVGALGLAIMAGLVAFVAFSQQGRSNEKVKFDG